MESASQSGLPRNSGQSWNFAVSRSLPLIERPGFWNGRSVGIEVEYLLEHLSFTDPAAQHYHWGDLDPRSRWWALQPPVQLVVNGCVRSGHPGKLVYGSLPVRTRTPLCGHQFLEHCTPWCTSVIHRGNAEFSGSTATLGFGGNSAMLRWASVVLWSGRGQFIRGASALKVLTCVTIVW